MSPLIDVTNSGDRNCSTIDKSNKNSEKKGHNKVPRPRVTSVLTNLVGDTSTGPQLSKKCAKSKPNKMCNTLLKSSVGDISVSTESLRGSCGVDSLRVPPLPQVNADDVLSQAVQALNLGPLTVEAKPSARHSRHRKFGCKETGKSSSGHPENTNRADAIQTPQQCGACGLEFTSLPVLTQHLARHVYDGLYAAQWLTQAMTLVSSRQAASDSVQTTVHSVPSGEGENADSQSTPPP